MKVRPGVFPGVHLLRRLGCLRETRGFADRPRGRGAVSEGMGFAAPGRVVAGSSLAGVGPGPGERDGDPPSLDSFSFHRVRHARCRSSRRSGKTRARHAARPGLCGLTRCPRTTWVRVDPVSRAALPRRHLSRRGTPSRCDAEHAGPLPFRAGAGAAKFSDPRNTWPANRPRPSFHCRRQLVAAQPHGPPAAAGHIRCPCHCGSASSE
jgi:hypothetical protein